jgi:hypothetical protein
MKKTDICILTDTSHEADRYLYINDITLLEFLLERETFQTKFVQIIKTFLFNNVFPKIAPFMS